MPWPAIPPMREVSALAAPHAPAMIDLTVPPALCAGRRVVSAVRIRRPSLPALNHQADTQRISLNYCKPALTVLMLVIAAGACAPVSAQTSSTSTGKSTAVASTVDFRSAKWLSDRAVVNNNGEAIAN